MRLDNLIAKRASVQPIKGCRFCSSWVRKASREGSRSRASEILAGASLLVASVALYMAAQHRRNMHVHAQAINNNADTLLGFMDEHEQRINQVETFVYSGGAIDQRKDGGVW